MLEIGQWSISLESGLLRNGKKESISLEPRLATLCLILLEQVNQVVSREELTVRMWPDTIVNEDSLTRAVSDLRKVLKNNFSKPPKIETHHKRGYKLRISKSDLSPPLWRKALKCAVYFCIGFILLILVIRGLNY